MKNRDIDELVDDLKPVIPRPSIPLPNSVLYRLSGIETDEEMDSSTDTAGTVAQSDGDEFLQGEWPDQFNLSEFQPNQFFANWDTTDHQDAHSNSEADQTVNPV